MTLMLAACGGGDAPSSAAPAQSSSAASAEKAASPAASSEPDGIIKIAVAGPMTGDNAEYGIGFYYATELMAKQWNEKGGVNVGGKKYQIEVLKYDDKSSSDEAMAIAEQIVSDDDIIGVIGHFASGICMAAAPTYQESGYINISPTSSHADYSKIGDYIFRNNTVITVETRTGAEMAVQDLGGKAIGILSIDTEWGQTAGNAMEENIKALGGNFVLRQQVATEQVDFATEIANFKGAGADVIMVAGMYGTLAPFAKACAESNYEVKLVGCSNAYTENLIQIAGEAANGIYAPVSFFAGDPDPAKKAYVDEFALAYGTAPSALTTQAYDSAGILLQAIENAGTLDRQAIRDEIYKIEYEGMSGFTTFDEIGDAQKVFTKIMVKDGAFVLAEFN
ncbi:MAG: ABC transporter substrate-binding protein [Oscillospiraceae bacterium]